MNILEEKMEQISKVKEDIDCLITREDADTFKMNIIAKYNLTYLNQGATLGFIPFVLVAGTLGANYIYSMCKLHVDNECQFVCDNRDRYWDEYRTPLSYELVAEAREARKREIR